MSAYAYKDVFDTITNSIQHLSPEEQIIMLDDVKSSIQKNKQEEPQHDIMEFMGFAEDLWKDVDVSKYLSEERSAWGRSDEVRKSWDG